jgi:hypothetical protein
MNDDDDDDSDEEERRRRRRRRRMMMMMMMMMMVRQLWDRLKGKDNTFFLPESLPSTLSSVRGHAWMMMMMIMNHDDGDHDGGGGGDDDAGGGDDDDDDDVRSYAAPVLPSGERHPRLGAAAPRLGSASGMTAIRYWHREIVCTTKSSGVPQ